MIPFNKLSVNSNKLKIQSSRRADLFSAYGVIICGLFIKHLGFNQRVDIKNVYFIICICNSSYSNISFNKIKLTKLRSMTKIKFASAGKNQDLFCFAKQNFSKK